MLFHKLLNFFFPQTYNPIRNINIGSLLKVEKNSFWGEVGLWPTYERGKIIGHNGCQSDSSLAQKFGNAGIPLVLTF